MSELQYAGEFNLEECTLLTSAGLSADLKDSVYQIDIFEELNKNTISGSVFVFDTNNILTQGQVIGQDYLLLKISTPQLTESDDRKKIDYSKNALVIYNVKAKFDINNGAEGYQLDFMSAEGLYNHRTRLSRSFKGSNSEIVEDILRNDEIIGTKKKIFIEPTSGSRKYIVPNIHPFQFIKNLARDSRSDTNGSPHYHFYETTKGFHFRTLQSLYNQESVMNFNEGQVGTLSEGSSKTRDVSEEFSRLIKFGIAGNYDMLSSVRGGLLGSKCVKVNTYNHTYATDEYSYFNNFNEFDRINGRNRTLDNPIYTESVIDERGNTLGSFTDARTFLHPVHSDSNGFDALHDIDGSLTFQENSSPQNITRRKAKMFELETSLSATVRANGHTDMEVGQIVFLSRPGTDGVDAEYTGRYLVTKLRHTFLVSAKKHEVSMALVRDSSAGRKSGHNVLPKSTGGATVKIKDY